MTLYAGEMNAADIRELEALVQEISTNVEEMLDTLLPKPGETEESRLFEAMRYSVFAGGKRLRPFLIMATNQLLGGRKERALRVACAMEMLHTYSLIHDDLPCMDNDDLRRGKPTCHIQFDEATAVLAGDALLTYAFEVLSHKDTHPDGATRANLVQLFAMAAGPLGMVGGQMIDIVSEGRTEEIDQGALARLQRKKTGALFSACCEAAVILNGATHEEHHRLSSYARNIGLAFQMTDDILDEIGEEEKLGKRIQKDKKANKATFASLLGIEGAKRQSQFLCGQAGDYLRPFGEKARALQLLALFVASRSH